MAQAMETFYMQNAAGQVVPVEAPNREAAIKGMQNLIKGEKQQAQVAEFAQRLDTTPSEPFADIPEAGQPVLFPRGGRPARTPEVAEDDRRVLVNNAAEAGVDVSTGAPSGLRARADLLELNPQAKYEATEYLVAKELEEAGVELPEGVPAVFKEENTGQLAYWRPTEDGKFKATLLNPPGLDQGDVITNIDDIAEVAVEIPAAVGGALAAGGATGGNPAAAALGGATAAAAVTASANKLRKEIARQAGIPDEIVDKITTNDQMTDALMTAGFEMAGPVAAGVVRRVRNIGRPLTDEESVKQAREAWNEVRRASDQIAEETGIRIVPTSGGAARNEKLLVLEASARRDASNKKSRQMKEQEVANRLGLGDAIKRIVDTDIPDLPPEVVERTTQSVQGNIRQTAEQAQKALDVKEKALDDLVEESTDILRSRPWLNVQREADGVLNTVRNQENGAWQAFREHIGFDHTNGVADVRLNNSGNTPIKQAVDKLHDGAKRALSASTQRARQELAENLSGKVADDGLAPLERLYSGTLDMHELHHLSSVLKAQQRQIEGGKRLDWEAGDIKPVLKAIDDQIDAATFRGSDGRMLSGERAGLIRDSFKAARKATVTKVQYENREVVNKILATDGKEWVAKGDTVRTLLFKPGDSAPLAEVMRAVDENPQIKSMVAKELDNKYRSMAINPEGNWTKGGHDAFMDAYRGHAELILGKGESDLVRNAADMGKRTKQLAERNDRVAQMLKDTYGRDLSSADVYSGNIASDIITGKLTLDQSQKLTRRLAKMDPQLLDAVRKQGSDYLKNKLMSRGDNVTNAQALNNLLRDNQAKIEALHGKKMVGNLRAASTIMNAMEASTLGKAEKTVANTPMMQAFRSIFGPLSPIQRRLTAAQRLRAGFKNAVQYEILMDPQRLDTFVKLSRTRPGTVAALQGFTALGIPLSEMPEETQEVARRAEQAIQNSPRGVNSQRLRELIEQRQEEGVGL